MVSIKERSYATDGFIDRIESEISLLEPIEVVPVHHFCNPNSGAPNGIYAREITIPEGAALTGKIHKTDHLNILSKGTITVWSDDEGERTISAPFTFVAKAGARRFGYAHTECVWTTIHGTNETDLDKLEDDLVVRMQPVLTIKNTNQCRGSL